MKAKTVIPALLCAAALTALAACGGTAPASVSPSSAVSGAAPSATVSASQARSLTAAECAGFEDFIDDVANNGFLASDYSRPQDCDPNLALYNGCGRDVQLTRDEISAAIDVLASEMGESREAAAEIFDTTDHNALSTKTINSIFAEKLGLSLGELTVPLRWTYLQKYDLYISSHGDTNYYPFDVASGAVTPDGLIVLHLKPHSADLGPQYCAVTLKPSGGSYMFMSNTTGDKPV